MSVFHYYYSFICSFVHMCFYFFLLKVNLLTFFTYNYINYLMCISCITKNALWIFSIQVQLKSQSLVKYKCKSTFRLIFFCIFLKKKFDLQIDLIYFQAFKFISIKKVFFCNMRTCHKQTITQNFMLIKFYCQVNYKKAKSVVNDDKYVNKFCVRAYLTNFCFVYK